MRPRLLGNSWHARYSITTVVMTRNRRDELLRTLQRLDGPVIVVDNGSTDGTPDAVLERCAVRTSRCWLSGATTAPWRARSAPRAPARRWWPSRTTTPGGSPGALARAGEAFAEHPRLGLLAAKVLVGDTERVDAVSEAMAAAPLGQAPDLPGPDVLGFIACATVVRREAFLGVGGFDDVVFFAGEEERVALDLAAAGWGLAYVDDVVAHHQPSPVRATPAARQALIERNHVLTALMRRPWPVVRERWAARCAPRQESWAPLRAGPGARSPEDGSCRRTSRRGPGCSSTV